jgi:beta-barrel assembly-enhancing protease
MAGVAVALLCAAGCTGAMGLAEEEELGDDYAAQIAAQVPLMEDPEALAELTAIGNDLAARADPTGRRYDFHLVDSPEMNAFAIPGGHIYVNRGLIARADDLSELAGVLGHEIAHVTERHGIEQAEKRQQTGLLVSLFYLLIGRDPGLVEQIVIQGGASAVFARYGRDAEREADAHAVATLVAAGYDPEGIATFFEELLREQRGDPSGLEQWFASHPTSAERVANVRALIDSLGPLDQERLMRNTPEYDAFRERVVAGYGR